MILDGFFDRHDSATQLTGAAVIHGFERAIAEATLFVGATNPNPPVGCALLDASGEILCVEAHHRAGTAHAEARALATCRERGILDRVATAIVTLEPCNHTGRTPPCTQALIASPVRTIWIGTFDPNPLVAGSGAQCLRDAGRQVHVAADGAQARSCRALIAPFARYITQRKAWITVKQALDTHGSMVPPKGQKTFTSPQSLRLAHELRRSTDAIITGAGTIRADDPGFDVRNVADHPDKQRKLIVCDQHDRVSGDYVERAHARGLDVSLCRDVRELPRMLAEMQCLWALVEGGPRLLAAIDTHQLWDDWFCIRQESEGRDAYEVSRRHDTSPLDLFGELAA